MNIVRILKTGSLIFIFIFLACNKTERKIYLGMGAKAGEITSTNAIVHVRLTETHTQDASGYVPGKEGEARLYYGTDSLPARYSKTDWLETRKEDDYSVQFKLKDLTPASRYYYRVEMRENSSTDSFFSDTFSFKTAPDRSERAQVKFQVTTGQDILGIDTYYKMALQHPDFLVSTGDNVYYDQGCDSRTIQEAYRCYQIMYGSKPIVDYFRHIGGYFEKDDHDYRFNDADTAVKGRWINRDKIRPGLSKITKEEENRVYDETWLTHKQGIEVFKKVFPMSEPTYRTFRWGKGIQIWLLEGRDFRSPNIMPDGPEKSIWGVEQKAWLKTTLLESDADFKIIISPTPLIGPDNQSKMDNHADRHGFWTEGRMFLDWLSENNLHNVSLICGDRHWQYHSVYNQYTHEFSCGPTCDEHSVKEKPGQHPPPASEFENVAQPYVNYCGGFLTVTYTPDQKLYYDFYSEDGRKLYSWQ
jgi:alkaline phosphatase/alkaline phosphatase D